MELTGKNPLDPASWKKHPEPAFRGNDNTFGTGHGGFVKSPDGKEWWHVYHAKRDRGGKDGSGLSGMTWFMQKARAGTRWDEPDRHKAPGGKPRSDAPPHPRPGNSPASA